MEERDGGGSFQHNWMPKVVTLCGLYPSEITENEQLVKTLFRHLSRLLLARYAAPLSAQISYTFTLRSLSNSSTYVKTSSQL